MCGRNARTENLGYVRRRRATRPIRVRGSRTSRPHEPQPKADREPIAGAPATLDGAELGQWGEEAVAREDPELQAGRERRKAKQLDASASQQAATGAEPQQRSSSASSSSRTRRPDHFLRSREQHAARDQGGNPERPDDWTNFDVGRVARLFRASRERSGFRCPNFASGGDTPLPTR
jgi:hypothetical protein